MFIDSQLVTRTHAQQLCLAFSRNTDIITKLLNRYENMYLVLMAKTDTVKIQKWKKGVRKGGSKKLR